MPHRNLVTWSEEYAIGLGSVDAQHQGLFSAINELWDAIWTSIEKGTTPENIDAVMARLEEYTISHFDEEEALMAARGFAGIDAHRAEHEIFKTKIREEKAKIQASHMPSAELAVFLNQWLAHHIKEMDRQYAA